MTPKMNEPFFMALTQNRPDGDVYFIEARPKLDSIDSLELAIAQAKHMNGFSTIYYCVPVGEADAAHSHMKSTLEVLGSAALGLEGGGYDSTEGTALTG